MDKDPFKKYIKESEPAKREKGYAWHTAIGLQAVDGLKTSEYLVRTAARNIEGEITFDEANELLQSYYKENPAIDSSVEPEKAGASGTKVNIGGTKANIGDVFTPKTASHIKNLREQLGQQNHRTCNWTRQRKVSLSLIFSVIE